MDLTRRDTTNPDEVPRTSGPVWYRRRQIWVEGDMSGPPVRVPTCVRS